jgi:preprotein translocase subunit SecD
MRQRYYINLILILILLGIAIWIDLPNNPGIKIGNFERSLDTVLGLDLKGGMQVLLEADLPADVPVDAQALDDARRIVENRSNGLGVKEVVFQVAGNRRIVGEFPGLTNTEEVTNVLKETGQLEFVDMGDTPLPEGTVIKTTLGQSQTSVEPTGVPTTEATTETPQSQPSSGTEDKVWTTIMTGDQLKSVSVTTDQLGKPVVQFELKPEGQKIFADFTSKNVGKYLAIVLDKKIISVPVIRSAITEGSGIIEGNFTVDTANALAVQLRYGSLPIPLKVVESRVIGPTLGEDSLNKSLIAGMIGFALVTLFMIIYYRLPGGIAILAIINYGLITLALFKLIPVTLTLPGIAGFLLSTGGALDANILIFERLKEELRNGRTLRQAVDLGWKRAWPSIRDSNIATLITSTILFWFGSAYGASIVKGFAVTLALGVAVSLFSAIVITRTFLNVVLDFLNPAKHQQWFGA